MYGLNVFEVRRANAEGLDINAIANILAEIHAQQEHGVFTEEVTDEKVRSLYGMPQYRGGYLYRGWEVIRNDVLPESDILETRWSKSPTSQPTTPQRDWDYAVHQAKTGDEVHLEAWFERYRTLALRKTGEGLWVCTEYDATFAEECKSIGVTLYEGIRQEVADRLGVEPSSLFHRCFDAAVDRLEQEAQAAA